MSKQHDIPKSLQSPSNPGPAVGVLDDAGVTVGYKPASPAVDPSGTPEAGSPEPRPDAPSEAVAIPRQPETPLPELPAGSIRLGSGIVRSDAGGVQISSRPDSGSPFTFPSVPSKTETLSNGIVRSTM